MYKIKVEIEGMACAMWENHLQEAFRNIGMKHVKANRKKKEVTFLSEKEVNDELIQQTVKNLGYDYKGMTSEIYHKKRFIFF